MRREDAIMISEDEMLALNNIEDVIRYLMSCYDNGRNIYYVHNGVTLYSCDGYTFDEYYIMAMGLSANDKRHLDSLVYGEGRTNSDMVNISKLILPIYSYLKEMNQPFRDELINGRNAKKI